MSSTSRPDDGVVVGIDNGGTKTNATVLALDGRFLVDRMLEVPSRVTEGPAVAIEAMVDDVRGGARRCAGAVAAHGARGRARHARTGQRRRA